MTALIELDEVAFHYEASKPVLGPLSTHIEEGQITAILGPSGCGKSTLLRLMSHLRPISSGQLRHHRALQFGFVFQQATLLNWRSTQANIALPLTLRGDKNATAIADQWLARIGLKDRADALPRELSGGMQMRVSFARAMAASPDILLFDEPFAALDELTRHDLAHVVRDEIKKENLSGVFVTHSVQESVFVADRVLVMPPRAGAIVHDMMITGPAQRSDSWRTDDAYLNQVSRLSDILRGR